MNNVLFRRGDQTFIDENIPLNDGQIIFNETDEAIYVDTTIDGTVVRKRYGGGNLSRSDIDMALSTVSENPVANKVLTELMLQKADVIDDLGTALAVTENGVPTGCKTIQGLNTKTNNTQQMIAPIQTTLVASKTYAVGEQFIYNGQMYVTTSTIASGSAITINGNCILDSNTITDNIYNLLHITSSSSLSYSIPVNSGNIYKYRIGNLLFVTGYFNPVNNINSAIIIANVGNSLAFDCFFSAKGYQENNPTDTVRLKLESTGYITTENVALANTFYSFTFVSIIV